MKKILITLLGAILLIGMALPVSAKTYTRASASTLFSMSTDDDDFNLSHFSKVKYMAVVIDDIDLNDKSFTYRKVLMDRKIYVGNATIVISNNGQSRIGSLSDLKEGEVAHVLATRRNARTYDAVVVYQKTTTTTPPNPPPPSDNRPVVNFSAASHQVPESSTNNTHTITLSKPATENVTVSYTVSGTATGNGVDYTLSNGQVTIPAGQTSAQFNLAVVDDTFDENDETVVITLTGATNAHLGNIRVHTHTIQDNDATSVQFMNTTSAATENITNVTLGFSYATALDRELTLKYTVGGTATGNGVDYSISSSSQGEIKIPAGTSSAFFPLTVINDSIDEPDETIVITLTEVGGGQLGENKTHTHTIIDND